MTEGEHVERELMLVKLRAVGAQRAEIKRTADIFRGQIVDATESAYTVQLVGVSSKHSKRSILTLSFHFACSSFCRMYPAPAHQENHTSLEAQMGQMAQGI